MPFDEPNVIKSAGGKQVVGSLNILIALHFFFADIQQPHAGFFMSTFQIRR